VAVGVDSGYYAWRRRGSSRRALDDAQWARWSWFRTVTGAARTAALAFSTTPGEAGERVSRGDELSASSSPRRSYIGAARRTG